MTATLYRNIQASLRMYFSGKYSSGTWYIDRKNENMTEDSFIELQTSLGRRQDEKKAYQYDFAQLLVHSKSVATLDTIIGTLTAAIEGSGTISVMDYVNEEPKSKLGELQITRYELSQQSTLSNYAVRAITVYYEFIE
jgi:hypothetical protein